MTIIKGTTTITMAVIKGTKTRVTSKIKATNKTIQINMALSVAVAVVATEAEVVAVVTAAAMAIMIKIVINNQATGLGSIFCKQNLGFKFSTVFAFRMNFLNARRRLAVSVYRLAAPRVGVTSDNQVIGKQQVFLSF